MFQAVRNLRNQNHVGAAGDAGGERDVPGVAAHHLQHHDAAVAGGGGRQVVERGGGRLHRGLEADGDFGEAEIVVDGLGDRHQRDAALPRQVVQDAQAAVAADADQGFEPELAVAVDDLVGAVDQMAVGGGEGEGIALVGGAQDGAALAQHVGAQHLRPQLHRIHRPGQQAGGAVADAHHRPAQRPGPAIDRANHRIEAGAIAAAGQDADPLACRHAVISC